MNSDSVMNIYEDMNMNLIPICRIKNRPRIHQTIDYGKILKPNTNAIVNNLNLALLIFLSMISIVSGKCYTFQSGLTIKGSDYRKEYELSYKSCGKACHDDLSCMAFEWNDEKECVFKARSLNGTIVKKTGAHFGLCLDRNDIDNMRDAFYDHELGGHEYSSSINVHKDECPIFCLEQANKDSESSRLSYSWMPFEPRFTESTEGKCSCIDKLFYVKLSYGSVSSYLS